MWTPGHINRQAPPTALHGVKSHILSRRDRGPVGTSTLAMPTLMRFFPQFKGFCLPAVFGELKPNRCMGIDYRCPIPRTQQVHGHPPQVPPHALRPSLASLPILLWSLTWHSAPFSGGSCWSMLLLVLVAIVMVVGLKLFM